MGTGAPHFPEGDVIVPVHWLIGLRSHRLWEHNQKSVAIRLADPVEVFRSGFCRASDAAQHKHNRRMGCEMRRSMNNIGTTVAVMDEWPGLGLPSHCLCDSHYQRSH